VQRPRKVLVEEPGVTGHGLVRAEAIHQSFEALELRRRQGPRGGRELAVPGGGVAQGRPECQGIGEPRAVWREAVEKIEEVSARGRREVMQSGEDRLPASGIGAEPRQRALGDLLLGTLAGFRGTPGDRRLAATRPAVAAQRADQDARDGGDPGRQGELIAAGFRDRAAPPPPANDLTAVPLRSPSPEA
jgi:hypothetical protein